MAKKESSFGEIKKAVIGVVTLLITTAGGLIVANMEKIFNSNEEVIVETVHPEQNQSVTDTIVVITQQKKETPVVAKPESPIKKKEYDW